MTTRNSRPDHHIEAATKRFAGATESIPRNPHQLADRAAIRRIITQLQTDPAFWEQIALRWIADMLQEQLSSTWLDLAADYEKVGRTVTAARCRIHAHLLADGDALDPKIAADVAVVMAHETVDTPTPMHDEITEMVAEDFRVLRDLRGLGGAA